MRGEQNVSKKPRYKWEMSVLFDATQEAAELFLERYGVLIQDVQPTAAVALSRINDIEAWEKCRCGR